MKIISTIFTENIQNAKNARGLKRYYEKKISNQQKYIMKKTEIECYYRNKTIDVYNLETQLDLMLN